MGEAPATDQELAELAQKRERAIRDYAEAVNACGDDNYNAELAAKRPERRTAYLHAIADYRTAYDRRYQVKEGTHASNQ